MDKSEANVIYNILYAELFIGRLLLKYPNGLSIPSINNLVMDFYSESEVVTVIRNLVSYGLVTPVFNGKADFSYCITDFGVYYFNMLSTQKGS